MAEDSDQDLDADLSAFFSKDEPAPAPRRVLIVDDSSLSRKTIAAILQQMGCEVLEAADGAHAIELMRGEQFQLIILDVVMPGMSGLEFLKHLREEQPATKTPVIMLTVKADLNTVSQALNQGVADYLLKHSSPEEIKNRLQKHLGL